MEETTLTDRGQQSRKMVQQALGPRGSNLSSPPKEHEEGQRGWSHESGRRGEEAWGQQSRSLWGPLDHRAHQLFFHSG